jgi:hypothetical protein
MEHLWAFRSTKENTCHPGISIAHFSTMNQRVHIPDPYLPSIGFLKLSPPKNKMPKLDLHHWTLGKGGKWGCCNLLKSMGQSNLLIPFHLGGKSLKN